MADQDRANAAKRSPKRIRPQAKEAVLVASQATIEHPALARPFAEPVRAPERPGYRALEPLLRRPRGAFGGGSVQVQATRLADHRLQVIQRQQLVGEISRVQGNRHLQRVIAAPRHDGTAVEARSDRQRAPVNRELARPRRVRRRDAVVLPTTLVRRQRTREALTANAGLVQPMDATAARDVERGAVPGADEAVLVRQWIAAGNANENDLTNELFFHRHPELDRGTRLKPKTPQAREWLETRDRIVRPALKAPASAGEKPAPTLFGDILRPLGRMLKELLGKLDSAMTEASKPKKDLVETKSKAAKGVKDTLDVAMELEGELRRKHPDYGKKGGFVGYGTGKDQYVCTTFAEKVLKEAGYVITKDFKKRINIRMHTEKRKGMTAAEREAEKLHKNRRLRGFVEKDDPRAKGVVNALVSSGQGVEIAVEQLKSGDFVQYWYNTTKVIDGEKRRLIGGHVVQVTQVLSPGKIRAHGSHGGTRGVTTITVNLNSKLRVYCVRPSGSPHYDEIVPSAEASAPERPAETKAEKSVFDRVMESVKTAGSSARPDKAPLPETTITGGKGKVEAREPLDTAVSGAAVKVASIKGKFALSTSANYKETLGGVSVRPSLKRKVMAMAQELIENALVTGNITLTSGMRGLAKAHRWSTAYAIRQGHVTYEKLKTFRNSKGELGKDQDGNIWYKTGWTKAQVLANAKKKWSGALAAEGYRAGDPRREPNTYPNVTPHAAGRAIDMVVPWKTTGKTADPARVAKLKRDIETRYKGRPGKRDKALSTVEKFIARGSYSDLAAEMTAKHGLTRTMLYKASTEDWHYQEEPVKKK